MRTKRLSVLSGEVDDVMELRGSDGDAVEGSAVNTSQRHPRAGWTAEQVDETVLAAAPGDPSSRLPFVFVPPMFLHPAR